MNAQSRAIPSLIVRIAGVLSGLLLCAASQAQSVNIATSLLNNQGDDNNVIFGVTATLANPPASAPPSLAFNALPINNSEGFYSGGLSALTYAPSTQPGVLDLIGAIPYGGPIFRFFGPSYSSVLTQPVTVWSCPQNPQGGSSGPGCSGNSTPLVLGPQYPLSMAVDANGTLWVLSQDLISSGDQFGAACQPATVVAVVELWAFPASAGSASGFVSTPILVDPNVAGAGGSACTARNYASNNIDVANGEFASYEGESTPLEYPSPGIAGNPQLEEAGSPPQMDLAIAPANVAAPITPNDVLVLFGDNAAAAGNPIALVADYHAANLQAVLSCTPTSCPLGPASVLQTPLTVANSIDLPAWGTTLLSSDGGPVVTTAAVGENALSLAAWPQDASILLLSDLGNIYRFSWAATGSPPNPTYTVVAGAGFPEGVLPTGCATAANFPSQPQSATYSQVGLIRTGTDASHAYAFVTQYTCPQYVYQGPLAPSMLLALDGTNTPTSATESDGALAGLAVNGGNSPSQGGTGTGSGCVMTGGCNITGGAQQLITGTPAAIAAVQALAPPLNKITENVCIVPADPRAICGATSSTPGYTTARTLPVKSVCPDSKYNPSFGTTVIPDYICGSYGPGGQGTGNGFVVIQGIAPGVDAIPGLLDFSDVNPDYFFNTTPPPCSTVAPEPGILFGWSPWSGESNIEGTIPEGQNMIELTYGCGTSKGNSSGMSLLLLGGKLDLASASEFKPNNLTSFAEFKYGNLLVDVAAGQIDLLQKVRLLELITESEIFLIDGQTQCAARKLWRADKYVTDHATHFEGIVGRDPNAYGRARSRLANLFFTLYTRIEGNPAPQTWPVARPPGTCQWNRDVDHDGY
jgi:hypothetical protein